MSHTDSVTLSTLPVEIIHSIFDHLDGTTVLLSVRDVCRRLRATVDNYHRWKLDLTTMSKRDFYRLLVRIHPQDVTALTLNDRETPGQIGLFLSLINIDLFTQLRSLTLVNIEEEHLCLFLEHARSCSLTSLTLESMRLTTSEYQRIAEHLSSIISQPTFLRLGLLTRDLCELNDQLEWPIECKLQYLRMASCTKAQMSKILLHASDLQTLYLGTTWGFIFDNWANTPEISLKPHAQLTSLAITSHVESIDTILSFLSFTPSLRHLKIITLEFSWLERIQCEEIIKSKLPALDKFEFYSSFFLRRSEEETDELTLHQVISPFHTPFWTEEKRWSVRCNWFPTIEIAEIYTSPICTSKYMHRNDPNTKTVSNFSTEDRQSMITKDIYQLHIAPCRPEPVENRVR